MLEALRQHKIATIQTTEIGPGLIRAADTSKVCVSKADSAVLVDEVHAGPLERALDDIQGRLSRSAGSRHSMNRFCELPTRWFRRAGSSKKCRGFTPELPYLIIPHFPSKRIINITHNIMVKRP